jgi:hypothetical protein
MLGEFFRLAAVPLAALLAPLAMAQDAGKKQAPSAAALASVPIPVTNSAKDTEIAIANMLKVQLQLESSLKLVNDDPDNLRLVISFRVDEKQGTPRINSVIDTVIVARDKDGNAVSQSINIAATADIVLKKEQLPKLLRWSNAWNARMLPIRVFIAEGRVYTATTILGTVSEPSTSHRVLGSFLSVVRAWPAVIKDLKANKFIPE